MSSWNNFSKVSDEEIIATFFKKVAGQKKVKTGYTEYIRPLNYETDDGKVVVVQNLPVLDLKGEKLESFKNALINYVRTFGDSDLHWANPVTSCRNQEDRLVHALSTIWLNATPIDYENPAAFLNRYSNFLRDTTFREFEDSVQINRLQTIYNATLEISKSEQTEFQETPEAITFVIRKDDVYKELPRIAFGISDNIAYIYGVQSKPRDPNAEANPTIKKINRSRFAVNRSERIPEDHKSDFMELEPYAYISLFAFFNMLKQKGITGVVMQASLPERVVSKKLTILEEIQRERNNEYRRSESERRNNIAELRSKYLDYKRVEHNIREKFLKYIFKMEYEVPGLQVLGSLDDTDSSVAVDISEMSIDEKSNIIFYEIYRKIEQLMKTKPTIGDEENGGR